ncbi:hypothetical protein ACFL1B_06370 [Nanoarchaeota archaeon]
MKRKIYGRSQEYNCPVCRKAATVKNQQGLPTCRYHSKQEINLKCACGSWLDIKESKYGTFFLCINCGPVSYQRGMEVNDLE